MEQGDDDSKTVKASEENPIKLKKLHDSVARFERRLAKQRMLPNRDRDSSYQVQSRSNIDDLQPFIKDGCVVLPQRKMSHQDTKRCDVLVVGGGPAGLAAALGAKRANPSGRVILLDSRPYFGGTITGTGMETLRWYAYPGTLESEGIGREMERVTHQMGGASDWPFNESKCLDPHHFKYVADTLVQEAGVVPMLGYRAVDAIMDSDRIKGVLVQSESGLQAVMAHSVVDATGNATIAERSGAEYRKTHKSKMMGVTTVFSVAGVNRDRFLQHIKSKPRTYDDWNYSADWQQDTTGKEDHLKSPFWGPVFQEAKQRGIIPEHLDIAGSWSAISKHGIATNLNIVHMNNVDCTDQEDITKAEMLGRQNVYHAIAALRALMPGFEDCELNTFSSYLGCRDSRYLESKGQLRASHVLGEGQAEDSIGTFPEFVDGYNILTLPTSGRVFEVPFSCMIPKRIKGLVLAGRHIDVDHIAHAAMRNMMACTVSGQASGVACMVAWESGQLVDEVPISRIQNRLRSQGVCLSKSEILNQELRKSRHEGDRSTSEAPIV